MQRVWENASGVAGDACVCQNARGGNARGGTRLMTCQCQGRDVPLASHEGRASLLEVLYASEGAVLSVTPDSRNRFLSLMRLCVLAWVCMGVYGSVLVYV